MIECKVAVGDWVVRNLAGILMPLKVTAVTDKLVICGDDKVPGGDETDHVGWWFDIETGAEVDEELGWGPPPLMTGSFLMRVANDDGDYAVPESVVKRIQQQNAAMYNKRTAG